jgi:hypothetical protein
MEEDAHKLKVVEDHMPLWNVARKEMCCCQFVLKFQKGKDVD